MPETIGDVKYSILEPGKFKSLNPGWELLTKQTLAPDNPLGSLGITELPDGRGVFKRYLFCKDGNFIDKNMIKANIYNIILNFISNPLPHYVGCRIFFSLLINKNAWNRVMVDAHN